MQNLLCFKDGFKKSVKIFYMHSLIFSFFHSFINKMQSILLHNLLILKFTLLNYMF